MISLTLFVAQCAHRCDCVFYVIQCMWGMDGIVRHLSCHHSSYSLAGKSLRWNSAKCNEIEQDYKRFMSELVLPLCRKWCSHTQTHTEREQHKHTAYRFLYYWATIRAYPSSFFSIRSALCEFRCTNVSNFFNRIHRMGNDLLFVQRIQHHRSHAQLLEYIFAWFHLFFSIWRATEAILVAD